MSKVLVTSALPYANGDIHLGHLLEYIQTDIYVRFLKLTGEDVVYMCASDTHGTPIEVNARKKGINPEDMVAQYNKEHYEDLSNFQIHFDKFYTTHSDETKFHSENIFNKLNEKGLIYTKTVNQFYCNNDKRFLPDRFVRGVCPKCNAQDQYGDSCEKCSATYSPTELTKVNCSICGEVPILKESKHYFVELEKAREAIENWLNIEGHVSSEMRDWLRTNFLKEEIHPWDISREEPYFGFLIPGEKDKYFYVWMDAPVGYIGTTQKYCEENGKDFDSYWNKDADSKIIHVIGKDIVYFHTLFWPAMLHYGDYKMPHKVHIHGFLTVNGEKMSKTRGTSFKAKTYLNHMDPQYLRYYYASKLSGGMNDLDLNIEEFRLRINGELVNKIVNLASRSISLLSKRLEGRIGEEDKDFSEQKKKSLKAVPVIKKYFENFEFSKAVKEINILAETANKYLQDTEPFKLVKSDPEKARAILSSAIGMVKGITILLGAVLPELKIKVERILNAEKEWLWSDIDFAVSPGTINQFEKLVDRIDEKKVEKMLEETKQLIENELKSEKPNVPEFKKEITFEDFDKIDLRIGKVIEANPVKKAKKLIQLTIDLGIEKRNVLAGISKHFSCEDLLGKNVIVVANLKPRKMKFGVSEAMMIVGETEDGTLTLLGPLMSGKNTEFPPGTPIA
jgi:methionyl-tRNA synthetase